MATRTRALRQVALALAAEREDWVERIRPIAEERRRVVERRKQDRERERAILDMALLQQQRATLASPRQKNRKKVEETLSTWKTRKVAEFAGETVAICGGRSTGKSTRFVLWRKAPPPSPPRPLPPQQPRGTGNFRKRQEEYEKALADWEEATNPHVCVWATKGLDRIVENQKKAFAEEVDNYGRRLVWLPSKEKSLCVAIQDTKSFWKDDVQIRWNPLSLLETPDPKDLQELQATIAAADELCTAWEKSERQIPRKPALCRPPPNKDCKRSNQMPEGEYLVRSYAKTTYLSADRTILFVVRIDENGCPNGEEVPVHGYFLEKEIANLPTPLGELETALYCRLGIVHTTPTKKKARIAQLFALRPQPPKPEDAQPPQPEEAQPEDAQTERLLPHLEPPPPQPTPDKAWAGLCPLDVAVDTTLPTPLL